MVIADGEFDFVFAGGKIEFLRDAEAGLVDFLGHFGLEGGGEGLRSAGNSFAVAVESESG